jgi:hypothetical protein
MSMTESDEERIRASGVRSDQAVSVDSIAQVLDAAYHESK